MLEVVEAGPPATIQDAGRPGWAHLGVPTDGAADPWSLAIANLLVGNEAGSAAVEMAFAGPRLRALAPVRLALAGAELHARIEPGRRPVPRGSAASLAPGDELVVPGPATPAGGLRAYLAVAGGFDVPVVLGSRSTCLAGGFGGMEGRPLRAGDRLRVGTPRHDGAESGWPTDAIAPRVRGRDGTTVLRIVAGPQPAISASLAGSRWDVSPEADRMGIRLEAVGGPFAAPTDHVTSHGVVRGTIQLPPDGRPICLLAAHQPTGGYPVAGVTIAADLPTLGQLAPGDRLRFELVSLDEARSALLARRAEWDAAVEVLRSDATWHDLWHGAGG